MRLPADFLNGSFRHGHPWDLYAALRCEEPFAEWPEPRFTIVSRYADVNTIAMDPVTFCSGLGSTLPDLTGVLPKRPTITRSDPPAHTRHRELVARVFRPSVIHRLEEAVRRRVRDVLATLDLGKPVDVVDALVGPLPIQVICEFLGLPGADWQRCLHWAQAFVPGASLLSEAEQEEMRTEAETALLSTVVTRRAEPGEDIISRLTSMEADGDRLNDVELRTFIIQLLVAGGETTRHAISGGLVAFARNPHQWQRIRQNPLLVSTAVEEILRWTSPVVSSVRTAVHNTCVGPHRVVEGERLLLLYGCANRDIVRFGPSADVFDVGRPDRGNLAFGFGPHLCLGASLARLEIRVLLEELLGWCSGIELDGEVVWNGSPVVTGPRSATLVFTE
ncbi:cytochrome P450 [Rhizohabitans arisaemae]|uniref:cytochrome P450 n=1 Tax=Rhizohabitans arisaemae TaxID=2720610 RepID=UPI0024B0C664|nr:cytochrome P450 [Rhizohabitans arisaemae]